MEFIPDVADAEAGALADLVVFQTIVVFQGDEFSVVFVEFGDEQLQRAERLELAERLAGIIFVVLKFLRIGDGSLALVVANVAEREIAGAAKNPSTRIGNLVPMRLEFHECVLDDVLCRFPLTEQTVGVAEQRRFLRLENLPECGLFLHGFSGLADRNDRAAAGISRGVGAGGLVFHEAAGAGSCFHG